MRRGLTERRVYRQLKILERHSAFKQPYKFRSHPLSELNYEFPGYPKWPPFPGPTEYPNLPPGPGECINLACNPSMLACKGGCTFIACICGPPLGAVIKEDPTGKAYIAGITSTGVHVCFDKDAGCDVPSGEEYPRIVVEVFSLLSSYEVEVAILNCRCCCESISLTGASTVNPGNTWTGTITPACPGATCEVVSNSGCSLSCNVNASGSQVTVGTAGTDCGGFTVTVTDEGSAECTATDSKFVRITGGSWQLDQSSGSLGMDGCQSSCVVGGGVTNYSTYCFIDEYKYGGFSVANPCEGTVVTQCRGPVDCTDPSGTDICNWGKTCAGGTPCTYFGFWRCDWTCSC